jgi:signal transduction histidine kinase
MPRVTPISADHEHRYQAVLDRYLAARGRLDREEAQFDATDIGRAIVQAGGTRDDVFDLHVRLQRRTEKRLAADPSADGRRGHRMLARGAIKPLLFALMVHQDLQELAQAEQRWRDSDARQQSVLDSVTDPIALIDQNGSITACNAAWRRTGLTAERGARQVGGDILGGLERAGLDSVAAGVIRVLSDREAHVERCSKIVGRELRVFEFRVAPLMTRVRGAVIMQIDVTRQTRIENGLHEADKLRATATMAAGIAHDFNNLLGSILGLTELSQLEAPEGSSLARNLSRILVAGGKAQALVRSMLDFARQTPNETERIRAARFLDNIEPLLRAGMPASVELLLEAWGDFDVTLDVRRMEQVLFNLVNNATHAMRARGGRVTIRVEHLVSGPGSATTERIGPCACISVADTGEGIPTAVIDRIFDPFFTTKPVGEGTGLGLAAVHGIVCSHGGFVDVASVPGEGTVFLLYLPDAPPPSVASGPEPTMHGPMVG